MTTSNIPRATGLLVIEVRNSNPNGDPDRESDPRTRSHDGRGVISDVSFKRKLRDLVWNGENFSDWGLSLPNAPDQFAERYATGLSPAWNQIARQMGDLDPLDYQIYVCRGRVYKQPASDQEFSEFKKRFWDCRLFGNTVIEKASTEPDEDATKESRSGKKGKAKGATKESGKYVRTGVIAIGSGVSVAKVRISRDTNTVKAAVQEGKDRGMAPLGFRIVEHGVYAMPMLVNPTAARRTDCSRADIELMCRLLPYAYPHNASRIRPFVEVRHAWYFEHTDQLGSASDFAILDVLAPKKANPDEPSRSWDEYANVGDVAAEAVRTRFAGKFKHFGDLCDSDFLNKVFPPKHA